jgi:hypothetical protein
MATAPALEGEVVANDTTGTDIVVAVAQNPGIVLLDSQKFDAFYEKLKAKAPTDADVTTRKGRETLRSFAAEVRSEKAAIDKARLRLTKEWRDMTSQANAAGKVIEERLEGLAVEVRAPLTAWEEAEKARVAACQAVIDTMRQAAIVTPEDTAASVRERGKTVWETAIDADRFGDLLDEAETAKAQTVATLKAALARLTQEEADRAELERLRAEAAARAEAERIAEEKARAEQAERDRLAEIERQRVAAEAAEAERLEQARRDAAEAAQREAERLAQEERGRVQREHEAALAAERQRAEEAERAAQAERERIAAEEAARAAEAKRLADEQAAREANQKHRTAVKRAAKEAIMTCGVSEECAQKIVLAIIAGEVPAVTLKF